LDDRSAVIRPLPTTKKNHTQVYINSLSGIRNHDPSCRSQFLKSLTLGRRLTNWKHAQGKTRFLLLLIRNDRTMWSKAFRLQGSGTLQTFGGSSWTIDRPSQGLCLQKIKTQTYIHFLSGILTKDPRRRRQFLSLRWNNDLHIGNYNKPLGKEIASFLLHAMTDHCGLRPPVFRVLVSCLVGPPGRGIGPS
jgi:hypothetical protein